MHVYNYEQNQKDNCFLTPLLETFIWVLYDKIEKKKKP